MFELDTTRVLKVQNHMGKSSTMVISTFIYKGPWALGPWVLGTWDHLDFGNQRLEVAIRQVRQGVTNTVTQRHFNFKSDFLNTKFLVPVGS